MAIDRESHVMAGGAFVSGDPLQELAASNGTQYSFLVRDDFTGRVKAGPQIETWQRRSAAAFTPAVILFIALPEAKDNVEPG